MAPPRRRHKKELHLPKTTILFFVGLGLLVHEAIFRGDPEPRIELLITYMFMMGFPIAEIGDILRGRVVDREDDTSPQGGEE